MYVHYCTLNVIVYKTYFKASEKLIFALSCGREKYGNSGKFIGSNLFIFCDKEF